ncbi:hypothetical protein [Gluconacetobacter tumulisoli]|uniref:Uncharacterized protein n=1 Tax=Gluconacetobacter tumulisoli TaxID=1286189 RepID=A0A7W4PNN8_9PROT|nr:hypothetical protein [Gluconacetobacter tumulisoli]MBB2201071.1 hypothetical protein [Gluconacetobacter tumulisoli]
MAGTPPVRRVRTLRAVIAVIAVIALAGGPAQVPIARAQAGCGPGPVGCAPNPAAQAQMRLQLQTEIQQRQFAARQRGLEQVERDRARLDQLGQQPVGSPGSAGDLDRRRQEQALREDIDRETAATRGLYHAQPLGPGAWTIQNPQGVPQATCREVGRVLVC